MLNDEHRISALIHYEMSDSKDTKDLNRTVWLLFL